MAYSPLIHCMFPALFFIIMLFSSQQAQAQDSNDTEPIGDHLIHGLCRTSRYKKLCFSSLHSNPSSSNATRRDLVHISVKQVISNVTNLRTHIRHLLNVSHDPIKTQSLHACYQDYTVGLRELKLAFKHFRARNYHLVLDNLNLIETVASDCDMEFKVGHKKRKRVSFPLTQRNLVTIRLARIAYALVTDMIERN